jgi:hypothetical protein
VALIDVLPSGMMLINDATFPVHLEAGVVYEVSIRLDLRFGADSFVVSVSEKSGSWSFQSGSLPTLSDAMLVNEVLFSFSDAGSGWLDLDNIRVDWAN